MNGEHALVVDEIDCRIGPQTILDRVSFTLQNGRHLIIIGPNGAGKTTLLKCLMRILPTTAGRITVQDRPLTTYTQKGLAKQISYVPQTTGRALECTTYEFVAMGRYPYLNALWGLRRKDKQLIDQALELTGTSKLVDQSLDTLSGGERQRVCIAAALAQEAKILLLDEPTTFLDPLYQTHIQQLIERLNRTLGLTVVSVTHDINGAVLWSDQILALKQGRVAFSGTSTELMDNGVLSDIYGKQFLFTTHPQTGERLIAPDGRAG